MSETTRDPSGQGMPAERPQGRLVTNYPTAPETLVITAPNNIPVSFAQLLVAAGVDLPQLNATIADLTQLNASIAGLQSQIDALTARVAALESAS